MECPNCQTQLRITRSYNNLVDGQLINVQELSCGNKRCKYGEVKIPVKVVEHKIAVTGRDDIKYCCENVLCRVTGDTVEVAPDILHRERDGKTIVACPNCKTEYSY